MNWFLVLPFFLIVVFPISVQAESASVEIDQHLEVRSNREIRETYRQNIQTSGQNVTVSVTRKVSSPFLSITPNPLVCKQLTAKIDARLSKYEANKDKWTSRHQGVVKHLENIAAKLEAKGCSASALRADISTYQQLVATFAASFRDFHLTLQGTRAYVCGQSQGQYKNQLQEAQSKLTLVKQNAQALQTFFHDTLKLHLEQITATCPNYQN